MGKEVRGKIPTTRVDRIPPYGAGALENQPFPSFGAWQKQAGGEKGSERDLNSGGKTRGHLSRIWQEVRFPPMGPNGWRMPKHLNFSSVLTHWN